MLCFTLITCIATFAWLSSGLSGLKVIELSHMLKFNLLDYMVKIESKDPLLARVWHNIELIP
jgi:hypothetical protein